MKFPEKYKENILNNRKEEGFNEALDQTRQAVEEAVSVEKIERIIVDWDENDKGSTGEKLNKKELAATIHKQIMDELFGN